MSEELEWELFDIFEAALFHFPVYEHNTARKVVRYLLYRGVIEEEIADAIEDSTIDLHLWLNRQGKNMVGEWVIAWINDAREEYLAEKGERGEEEGEGYSYRPTVSREHTPYSDSEASGGDAVGDGNRERHRRRDHPNNRQSLISPDNGSSDGLDIDTDIDLDETEVKRRITPSPPPLPPRSLTLRRGLRDVPQLKHVDSSPDSSELDELELDLSPKEVMNMTFTRESEFYCERTPDSGAVSDIYSSIPPDNRLSSMDSGDLKVGGVDDVDASSLSTIIHLHTDTQTDNSNFTFDPQLLQLANHVPHTTHCPTHGTQRITTVQGITICPNCTCTLAHYAYINKPIMSVCTIETSNIPLTESQDSLMQLTPPQQPTCKVHIKDDPHCDLYLNTETPAVGAMDINIDTLDRDGPGYIFIMTDSLENCLPWSSEHCYKVGSSRQPERYLTEFRSRNINVELIWQVRVQHHLKAVREIHSCLDEYNLHSNWFKCSLSVIMDSISKTVRKYKSA